MFKHLFKTTAVLHAINLETDLLGMDPIMIAAWHVYRRI